MYRRVPPKKVLGLILHGFELILTRNNLIWLFSIVCVILCSCSNSNVKIIEFDNIRPLKAELVDLNEILSPDFLTLKGGNLVISSSQSRPSMLFVYSTPSLEFMSDFGIKGRGPGEIQLFPMFCESPGSKDLYVWGYSPVTMKKIEILENREIEYKEDITLKGYETFNNMTIIGDSVFVYYLPDDLTVKKYNLENKNESSIILPKDNHRESFFYSNRGYIASSQSVLVYSYLFKKQIDIYDLPTLKLKTRIGDGVKYPKPTPGDFSSVTYHYVGLYTGERYFYALYDGKLGGVNRSLFLEVYDYDGNPVMKYSFDIHPILFVVDERNGKIYGFNEEYEDNLLRYNIE